MTIDRLTGEETFKPRSDLQVIIDIAEKSIKFDTNDLDFKDIQLMIGFRDNGKLPVKFNNLKFGYDLSIIENNLIKFIEGYDYTGYIETDVEYTENKNLNLTCEVLYKLSVWCYNDDDRFSSNCTFTVHDWQEYYPELYDVPKEGDPRFNAPNVQDPWWI
jgi:hypothetical protein